MRQASQPAISRQLLSLPAVCVVTTCVGHFYPHVNTPLPRHALNLLTCQSLKNKALFFFFFFFFFFPFIICLRVAKDPNYSTAA